MSKLLISSLLGLATIIGSLPFPSTSDDFDGGGADPLTDDPLPKEESYIEDPTLQIRFFPLEQGEAVLIQLPQSRQNILINTGSPESQSELLEWLAEDEVYHLNAIVLSNSSPSQVGGFRPLLQTMKVEQVVVPRLTRYLFPVASLPDGVSLVEAAKGDQFVRGQFSLQVLSPQEPLSLSPQNNAMVLLGNLERFRFLLTSEIGEAVESRLVEEYDLSSLNLLQVSDFGSNQASGEAFLQEVDAEIGIVFHNGDEEYSQSEEVMERLYESWMDVYTLPKDGEIAIVSNGEDYQVLKKRQRQPSPHA